MSALNLITTQDVSQDPGTHSIGNMDQNNNYNNSNTNQYVPNRLHPSFINNNVSSQPLPYSHHNYIGDSLNQQILLLETCHIATQNIRGGLSHLSKQISILFLLNNPPPSTTRIDIFGLAHTGLSIKQAKFAFTYDIFSNYKPFFSSASDNYLHSGVGLLLHNSFAIYVQKTGQLPGRVIYVDLYMKGKSKLRIIQVYLPPFNNNKDAVKQVESFLSTTITEATRNKMKIFLMGDLNCHSDKWMDYIDNGQKPPAQFNILELLASANMIDSLSAFHDDYLTADHLHTYMHPSGEISSRLDYHWLSSSLTSSLFFSGIYWPDYRVINSDHAVVHSILLTENLFDGKASAKLKQQDVGRRVIDYASTTTEHWSTFPDEIDKVIRDEIPSFASLNISNATDSSTLWTKFSNIVMRIAGTRLPHKKIYSHKRRPLPEQLSQLSEHWLLINRCFRLTSKPRLNKSPPRYPNIDVIITLNSQIALLAKEYNISLPELPLLVNLSAIKRFRKALNTVKQTVQALLKQEQKEYDTSQMLHFIEQRCTDFKDNQTRMINSILQRTQDKIVIDRLEVDNDLITDPASIRSFTANHFQNIVGRPASDGSIPEEWHQDYLPLESVDDSIYAGLSDPPSFTEWLDFVRLAPANKASSPSGVSYDLLKHLGPVALDVLHQITCSCFRLQSIPTG